MNVLKDCLSMHICIKIQAIHMDKVCSPYCTLFDKLVGCLSHSNLTCMVPQMELVGWLNGRLTD